jgi:hypothetical protein
MKTYVGFDGKTYTVLGGMELEVPGDVQLRIAGREAQKAHVRFINELPNRVGRQMMKMANAIIAKR